MDSSSITAAVCAVASALSWNALKTAEKTASASAAVWTAPAGGANAAEGKVWGAVGTENANEDETFFAVLLSFFAFLRRRRLLDCDTLL